MSVQEITNTKTSLASLIPAIPQNILAAVVEKSAAVSQATFFESCSYRFLISPSPKPRIYYISNEQIGQGTYGTILRVHELVTGNSDLVAKLPRYDRPTSRPPQEWRDSADAALRNEVVALRDLHSRHPQGIPGLQPLPVMVYDKPDLHAVIFERFASDFTAEIQKPTLPDRASLYPDIFYQIFNALAILDKEEYTHNDIRTSNISFDPQKKRYYLYDCSHAHRMNALPVDKHRPVLKYTSLTDRQHWIDCVQSGNLTAYRRLMKARDVFAASAALYMMVSQSKTFPYALNPKQEYATELNAFDADLLKRYGLPLPLISILEKCLCMDYRDRPTALQVLDVIKPMMVT